MPSDRPKRPWIGAAFRLLLLALGVSAVVLLVRHVGAAQLARVLWAAGPLLPLVFLLDAAWVAFEGVAFLHLLGERARRIPWSVWLRALLTHYATMVVLPVGRAGAEVARAAMVAPHVGVAHGSAAAARMQGVVLLANAAVSVPCAAAVAFVSGPTHPLTLLVLGNGVLTLVLGGGISLALARARLGGWLGARFQRLAQHGPDLDDALAERRSALGGAVGLALAGRALQTAQYGVILWAASGGVTLLGALVAQGIHLVGAGLGDLVPNQVGVTEGAYGVFAGSLGLADAPEQALAIALIARVSNLFVAGASFLALQLVPAGPQVGGEAVTPTPRAPLPAEDEARSG